MCSWAGSAWSLYTYAFCPQWCTVELVLSVACMLSLNDGQLVYSSFSALMCSWVFSACSLFTHASSPHTCAVELVLRVAHMLARSSHRCAVEFVPRVASMLTLAHWWAVEPVYVAWMLIALCTDLQLLELFACVACILTLALRTDVQLWSCTLAFSTDVQLSMFRV